ncbi:malectin domain-containing carbohydrate-binding protein, partial [Elusimicrobiota bacterium]
DGTYYYRVKAWTDTPGNGGTESAWSNVVSVTVSVTIPVTRDIVINEVSMDSTPDWVELYNRGTQAVDIQGWTLDNANASIPIEITEPVSIPAGAFLTIYIEADGTNDLDFGDGSGSYYGGTDPTVGLAVTEDEVVLYNSDIQNSSTIVDFTAYCSDGTYGGGANQADADAAGIWPLGQYISFTDTGSGYSIGLTSDGVDTDHYSDWSFFDTPTQGASNGGTSAINAPVITLPSADNDGNYQVNWNDVSGAVIYQWQESTDNSFPQTNTNEQWPTSSLFDVTGKPDGTYYYRVKAWDNTNTSIGNSSDWSNIEFVTVSITASVGPSKRINCSGSSYTDAAGDSFSADAIYSVSAGQGYVIAGSAGSTTNSISNTNDQTLYQTNRYGNIEYRFDLPAGMYNVTFKFSETYFDSAGQRVFNVYLHDIDNSNRGIKVLGDFDILSAAGGKNAAVDRTINNITVNEGFLKITFEGITDLPLICAIEVTGTPYVIGEIGMTDADFIDSVEYKAFRWFYDNCEAPYYLVSAWGPYNNYGFMTDTNIAGLGFQLIVYSIGIERNWITYQEGHDRIKGILNAIKLMKKGEPPYDNPYETYYHYYERLDPSADPLVSQDPVRSIFDNGDLMMGVVFVEEYFKGTDIELMAKQIYESLDWNKFGDYTYPTYSEEMIAVLLGASAPRASCRNNSMIEGFKNADASNLHTPLYFYQWFNLFFDGRNTSTPGGRNDFDYAKDSTLTNRQDCIDLWLADPAENNTYDWDSWGYTASSRYNDYGFASHYKGDVNPFAVAASMPFAPAESLNAMKHMYYRFYKNGFREYIGPMWSDMYGFCQTYNIGSSGTDTDYAPFYISAGNGAFDYGPIVMGIENYLTGFVWQHAMNSEYIKAGLYRIGMAGYTTPPEVNIAQDKPFAVSSSYNSNTGDLALDDDLITRWESDWSANPQWIYADLQDNYDINKVEIYWEDSFAVSYQVQTSFDAVNWTDVYSDTSSDGTVDRIILSPEVSGRYVRVYCTQKALPSYGYSMWGLKVFGDLTPTIDAPSISSVPSPDTDGDYQVNWNDISGAVIYQLQESSDPTFASGTAEYWPTSSFMDVFGKTNGTYYYRVMAWDNTDTGIGNSSGWSNVVYADVAVGATYVDITGDNAVVYSVIHETTMTQIWTNEGITWSGSSGRDVIDNQFRTASGGTSSSSFVYEYFIKGFSEFNLQEIYNLNISTSNITKAELPIPFT